MQPKDDLCRAALYPRFVKAGVFDDEALWSLSSIKNEIHYAISVASRFGLRDDQGVHRYGLNAARTANEGFEARSGRKPDVEQEVFYLGFYVIHADVIDSLPLHYFSASIKYAPEHGEREHFQIEIYLSDKNSSTRQRKKDRVALRVGLAAKMRGPKVYTSDEIAERPDWLSDIHLPFKADL
ncbi:hypothetical protein [Aureimonas sp. D3]|uniref:hypothetical protein n=1 Tax=Aureimonas sp. D3 TaxID=1638164 RepID=UPI0012E3C719|nr:hypothetical protein [Aureimonas sp. D3]